MAASALLRTGRLVAVGVVVAAALIVFRTGTSDTARRDGSRIEIPTPATAVAPQTTTAADVLAGRVRPEDVSPDIAAAIAPALLPDDWEPEPVEFARRLALLRAMGAAAGTAVERVIDLGDHAPRDALATLDAIDPARTLRMESLLRETGYLSSDTIDAEWALLAAGDASIAPLVDVLAGRREGSERAAARVLAALGAARPEVLAALRTVAASSDRKDAEEAAKALFRLSGNREVAVAALLNVIRCDAGFRAEVVAARPGLVHDALALVGADAEATRTSAALFVAAQGQCNEQVVAALVQGSSHPKQDHAAACLDTLTRLGPAAEGALESLLVRITTQRHPYEYASKLAAAVAAIGDRERSMPRLAAAFRKSGGTRRYVATTIVALDGPQAASILVEPLVARLSVAHTVGGGRSMWSGPRRTVHGQPWVADVLGSLGEAAAPAVPALITALAEDWVAANALDALGRVGAKAAPALRAALVRNSPKTRGGAAVALLQIEPSAEDAVPVLTAALRSTGRPHVSHWLRRLDGRHAVAVPAVRSALGDARPWVRVSAARALHRITGDAGPLVALIPEAIRADDGRRVACEMIAEAGRAARDVASDLALIPLAENGVPEYFVKAIVASGLPPADAVPLLAWAVRSTTWSYCREAAIALAALGPAAAPAVPSLVRALEADDGDTAAIAKALAAIGPAAAPALPELRWLLKSRWSSDRRAAREAIRIIEAGPGR